MKENGRTKKWTNKRSYQSTKVSKMTVYISSKKNNLLPRIALCVGNGGRCTGGNGALSIPTHAQHMVLPVVQRQAFLLAPSLAENKSGGVSDFRLLELLFVIIIVAYLNRSRQGFVSRGLAVRRQNDDLFCIGSSSHQQFNAFHQGRWVSVWIRTIGLHWIRLYAASTVLQQECFTNSASTTVPSFTYHPSWPWRYWCHPYFACSRSPNSSNNIGPRHSRSRNRTCHRPRHKCPNSTPNCRTPMC